MIKIFLGMVFLSFRRIEPFALNADLSANE
jgi:hypothetical protein